MGLIPDFLTEDGRVIKIDPLIRDRLVPNWREQVAPFRADEELVVNHNEVASIVLNTRHIQQELERKGFSFKNKIILEIGCYNGVNAFALGELAKNVHGIDYPLYYIHQTPNLSWFDQETISLWLKKRRDLLNKSFPEHCTSKVSFEDISIYNYNKPNFYDVVVSWDVIEHVLDINKFFKKIFDLLKPGGFSLNYFHPFFSVSGGHSLCTLDFPYGHCRVSIWDFNRYVSTYRPKEAALDISFYEKNLNKYTLKEIRDSIISSGLEIVNFVNRKHPEGSVEYIEEVRLNFPKVTEEDLLSDKVCVLLQKR